MWGALRWRWFRGPGYTRAYWTACLALTLFAGALRFHGIGEDGLSHDEFVQSLNARGSIGEVIDNTRWQNSSPILYPLMLWVTQKIDISAVGIRFIPALASTLTVAALALLLPLAGIKRSTAFLAALLTSVSAPAIHLAQDGSRQYMLDTLLIVVILTSGLLYLQGKGKYLFFSALFIAPLLHYGVPLFCVVMLIFIPVRRWLDLRNERGGIRSAIDASFFALAPALFLAAGTVLTNEITLRYHGTGHGLDGSALGPSYYRGDPADILAILEFSGKNIFGMLEYHLGILVFIMPVTIVAAFVISKKFRTNEFMVLFLLSIALALFMAVRGLYPFGSTHQTIIWIPVTFLLFAHSISRIGESISLSGKNIRIVQAGTVVLIIAIMATGVEQVLNRNVHRSGHPDSLIATIDEMKRPGDIVVLGNYMEWTMQFHYPDLPESVEEYHSRRCDCPGSIIGLFRSAGEGMWFVLHEDDRISTSTIERIANAPGLTVRNVSSSGLQLFLIESRDIRQARQYFIDRGELPDVSPSDLAEPIIVMEPYEVYREGRYLVYLKPHADSHAACVEQDAPKFFIHVEPVDDDALSANSGDGFDNFDFFFQHGLFRTDGFCFAIVTLPEYDVGRITTGQFTRDGNLWTRSVSFTEPAFSLADVLDGPDEPLLTHHPYEVYGRGNALVYVNVECTDLEQEPLFFLHVEPVNADDLPEHRREWGFDNLDFSFASSATYEGERCGVARELPDWPILRIRTGQYADGDTLWTGEFGWENGSGAAAE